ncbi:hypothetical protein [Gloeobacter kilaueensis]|uniref:Uncharacterized protein n=1 Tax=Gloeobacter kilaueensis (strain ATCC BAA-2537 / CCAP 1431/1 / ULC 316 / JS1) TaxID=1183438 RepID=U5QJL9_GLOK1|nr:hypothetical protein [Gloeobacter kilaueensis]AGY57840.1 hypothetical protein GKIL_1594 [Gloeobacter kilaueensis JS1]
MELLGVSSIASFALALLGVLIAALVGVALGAYAGVLTRPLTRAANIPLAAGIGVGSGVVASLGAVFLVVVTVAARLFNLPVGWLAAGIAFGLVIALVTLDWAGAALAGGFVAVIAVTSFGGLFAFFSLGPLLRFIPPFILQYALVVLSSLVNLAILLLVGLVAALVVRLLNQYVLQESNSPTAPPS